MEFFLSMIPPTATYQEKRVGIEKGKPRFYDPPKVKAARVKLTAHLARYKPEKPLGGPVRLVVKWLFPQGAHRDGEPHMDKPDLDNLQKLLQDCMTEVGFWIDDAQVVSLVAEKFWAEITGIYVCVEEIR